MTDEQGQAMMGLKLRNVLVASLAALIMLGAIAVGRPAHAADRPFIVVASTTSTEQSGLFGYLLPIFTARTGIEVRVVAV
ncbi:MAG TPA: hypothetical protein VI113_04185, partial [Alphaproteobacteria bacterium]